MSIAIIVEVYPSQAVMQDMKKVSCTEVAELERVLVMEIEELV